ncbi:MAG TPA: SCP2 sterol-binding domain-containing protein [Burkholderiaceae bacterium]|jgi:O2-independent ubiquinone biosynthesis accessory factor UbiT|nr:SCP2 sterol-binding domain-containing protein [Burkholderiaceae bacterium]
MLPQPATLLFQPLRLLPNALLGQTMLRLLNQALAPLHAAGDLDFLRERALAVKVDDLERTWCFTVNDRGIALEPQACPDAVIAGRARDLLMLASRREDPDTLFFKRRLRIEGDTELGLHAKHVLDAVELTDLPSPLRWALQASADVVARLP